MAHSELGRDEMKWVFNPYERELANCRHNALIMTHAPICGGRWS